MFPSHIWDRALQLGQQHSSVVFLKKKEVKLLSLKVRVRTRRFGGFFTTTTSRMAFSWEHPKDGAVCTEFVTSQPPSCCSAVNGVLATYFPPSCALSRGPWVCGSRQTPRMLLLEGKEHLPHAAQTPGLQLEFCPCSPSFEPSQSIQFQMHLVCARGTSKASPACLLFPAARLPGLTRGLTLLSNREDNISSPQGSPHIL